MARSLGCYCLTTAGFPRAELSGYLDVISVASRPLDRLGNEMCVGVIGQIRTGPYEGHDLACCTADTTTTMMQRCVPESNRPRLLCKQLPLDKTARPTHRGSLLRRRTWPRDFQRVAAYQLAEKGMNGLGGKIRTSDHPVPGRVRWPLRYSQMVPIAGLEPAISAL
jgi:hypothetical protein